MSAYHILHFRQKSFYYRFVGNIQVKQRIIGSIFPEKLIFEKSQGGHFEKKVHFIGFFGR